MKLATLSTLALSAAIVNARFVEQHEKDQVVLNGLAEDEQYLIELAPGETQWVTEEEKWELRRVRFEPYHHFSANLCERMAKISWISRPLKSSGR